MVGGTMARYFPDAILYDPPKGLNGDLNQADTIFLCLPTPYKTGGYDLNAIEEVMGLLKPGKTVVVRSTVLPGTTDALQARYEGIVLYNPEFLTEATAYENFTNPYLQVVGGPSDAASQVLELLPQGKESFVTNRYSAEAIKICRNVLSASKVVVLNELYDNLKGNWGDIEQGLTALAKIPSYHLSVHHKGGRGAGGKCLRKELNAVADAFDSEIVQTIRDKNEWLLKTFPKSP